MKLLTIGSCRVFEPSKYLQKYNKNNIDIINDWYKYTRYTHCTKDIIQLIKFLNSEIDIQDKYFEYIYTPQLKENKNKLKNILDNSETIIIEICSIKEHIMDDIFISREVSNLIFENKDLNAKAIKTKKEGPLLNVTRNIQNEEIFLNDINLICNLLKNKKIIFVCHVNIGEISGVMSILLVISRQFLEKNLEKGANVNSQKFFNPTQLINKDNLYLMLNKDLSHYTNEMIKNVYKELEKIIFDK